MVGQMIIVLVIIAGVVASAPIVATILVSVATRREESSWTLGGPATRPLDAAARRVMDFHSAGDWPEPPIERRPVAASIPVA